MSQLSQQLRAAILDEASNPLEKGRATHEVRNIEGIPLIVLEPQDRRAAPLEVSIDTDHLVTCFPGRNGMTCEFFSRKAAEIEEAVRGLTRAVISGDYSERLNDQGRRTKIVAQWNDGRSTETAALNVLREPSEGASGWQDIRYEPYE